MLYEKGVRGTGAVGEQSQGMADRGDWYVYLLRCADGTLYCGITKDVERRMAMHNGKEPGGARYTRGRRPVILLASTGPMEHGEALRLEHGIKRLRRDAKLSALSRGLCLDRGKRR